MVQLRAIFDALRKDKPIHLVVTTGIGGVVFLAAVAELIWNWRRVPFLAFVALWLVLFMLCAVLWFYWKGYSWPRYLVLLAGASVVIDALYSLTGVHFLVYFGARAEGSIPHNLLRLCIGAYFAVWLLTPEARRYFTTEARHERLSRVAAEAMRRSARAVI